MSVLRQSTAVIHQELRPLSNIYTHAIFVTINAALDRAPAPPIPDLRILRTEVQRNREGRTRGQQSHGKSRTRQRDRLRMRE